MIGLRDVFYGLFGREIQKGNRMLVVTEPSWCPPCRALDPHLKQLKKEGYDVHEYTLEEWDKAEPKPSNLPPGLDKEKFSIPVVMYVVAKDKTNKVVRFHNGGPKVTAEYMKQYLTK